MTDAVIVVPGVMGSELFDGDERVWPGTLGELLGGYDRLEKLMKPNLRVGDILRSVSVKKQYCILIDALNECGFSEAGSMPTLMVCPYDWRVDNARSAERLARKVTALAALHADDLQITIVAHSMGGLVSRYFLESKAFSEANCKGFDRVARLITLGTPHRGAPVALATILGQDKTPFLSQTQAKTMAANPAFPAPYQLLPPVGEPFLWNTAEGGRLAPGDVYDARISESLGLVESSLTTARTFHASLDQHARPSGVQYFNFLGTQSKTVSHVRADLTADSVEVQAIVTKSSGDGTVPSWSAALPGVQQLSGAGAHVTIFADKRLLSMLGTLLGRPGVLAADDPTKVFINLTDENATSEEVLSVVLVWRRAVTEADGTLVWFKVMNGAGETLAEPERQTAVFKVEYSGTEMDSMTVSIQAPRFRGVYELDLLVDGQSVSEQRPTLVVRA